MHGDDAAVRLLLRGVDADAQRAGRGLDRGEVPGETHEGRVLGLEHEPRDSGVSRSGSVVTKTTWRLSRSAAGSAFLATAMLLIVRGHTSGQLV
ncbi:hypothetical protein SF23_10905 [Streptomyces sp. MBRL 10]|nr:hypothetical protein SF23_10905 [Streptomyces sp. MBRL 10]